MIETVTAFWTGGAIATAALVTVSYVDRYLSLPSWRDALTVIVTTAAWPVYVARVIWVRIRPHIL